jgi:hypothetical protein
MILGLPICSLLELVFDKPLILRYVMLTLLVGTSLVCHTGSHEKLF